MDSGECVAATVVAAVTSAAGAVAACADAAACTLPKPHENILTLTGLEFSAMLSDPRYDEWFRLNLSYTSSSLTASSKIIHSKKKWRAYTIFLARRVATVKQLQHS
ncbi:hypothetical protein GN244_ATG07781 [Phytophthora infestans]|uniref:Uncharacterized protein n=1 Tax=Phytophthora infestans TaxID=4787 RepID=A0A833TAC8_PHYIN|nr:hypothetical protein GN244_ATG07781 [Phytophthora infestans]